MNIELKILDKDFYKEFPLPEYATIGSAGLDLRANLSNGVKLGKSFINESNWYELNYFDKKVVLTPNKNVLIPTGIAINIHDPGIASIICPRSGLGHNHGIKLGNTIGLIDSDYQGELFVSLVNNSKNNYLINHGDRIAQMFFVPIIQVKFDIVEEFNVSLRGEDGFGSTGK